MRAYLDLVMDRFLASGEHLGYPGKATAPYLSEADLREAQALFDRAEARIAADPENRGIRRRRFFDDFCCGAQ